MPASVKSFEAIQRMREELSRFARQADVGLTEIEAEVRRVVDWVEHDRPRYWKARCLRAEDAVAEAKQALHRCLMYPINDEQPACSEERAALAHAQRQAELAREKLDSITEWSQSLRHEVHEYKGRTAKLKQAIEIDAPRAVATLGRALEALEAYASGSSTQATVRTEAQADESSDAPTEEESP